MSTTDQQQQKEGYRDFTVRVEDLRWNYFGDGGGVNAEWKLRVEGVHPPGQSLKVDFGVVYLEDAEVLLSQLALFGVELVDENGLPRAAKAVAGREATLRVPAGVELAAAFNCPHQGWIPTEAQRAAREKSYGFWLRQPSRRRRPPRDAAAPPGEKRATRLVSTTDRPQQKEGHRDFRVRVEDLWWTNRTGEGRVVHVKWKLGVGGVHPPGQPLKVDGCAVRLEDAERLLAQFAQFGIEMADESGLQEAAEAVVGRDATLRVPAGSNVVKVFNSLHKECWTPAEAQREAREEFYGFWLWGEAIDIGDGFTTMPPRPGMDPEDAIREIEAEWEAESQEYEEYEENQAKQREAAARNAEAAATRERKALWETDYLEYQENQAKQREAPDRNAEAAAAEAVKA